MRSVRLFALLLALCLLTSCVGQPPSSAGSSSETPGASSEILPGETPAPPVDPTPGTSSEIPDNPGAQDPTPELPPEPVEQFVFTRDNFPRLNGSTSTVPLGKAIAAVLLGEAQDAVEDLTQFSKTTASYRQLMHGFADLLIAAEPAAVIWEEKAACGFEWEMAPFAVDGLVFVVNEGNPVDSLTIEQVQKIYTGEITNWSQVGGDDLDIVPFQRNAEAGSQTAMLKLVMGDLPMMDAPAEYVQGEMGDLIEAVAAYDGSAAAIGYTVYYYANDMRMADGLKIISINGVEPCNETIRSGAYPFLNNYYTLIPAGLPEDAPAKVMYDWLLSEYGQRLVAQQGYVSVLDVPGVPPTDEEIARSPVVSYWDVFKETTITPIYSWYEPRSADGLLQPRDDYGTLLKYIGTVSNLTDYITDRLPLYGLVTADGRVVTESVYADIGFYGDHFLVLYQGEVTGYRETEWGKSPVGGFRCTVAAADGSWTLDAGLCHLTPVLPTDDQIAFSRTDGSVLVVNADGTIAADFPRSALESWLGADFRWTWDGGPVLDSETGALLVRWCQNDVWKNFFLHTDTGTVSDTPPEGWEPYDYENAPPASQPEPPQAPHKLGYTYLDPVTDAVTGKLYFYGYHREWKRYDLLRADGTSAFSGCNLLSAGAYENCILRAGLLATADDDFFCYHDLESWEVVFRWPIRSNSD